MTYVVMWNDERGDLIDQAQYCNSLCAAHDPATHQPNVEEGDWPGGIETDSNEYCPNCGTMVSHGLEQASNFDCGDAGCPDCPPVVVNLVAYVDHNVHCERCGCAQYLARDLIVKGG